MKKHTTLKALAGLLVVLALVFTAGATSAFVGAKPFFLDAPLRFDYIPTGAGNKPILAADLDGNYVKAVVHSEQAITVTLQDGSNAQRTLSIPVGATLTGANYAADSGTLTLTLSDGGPVTADLSGLSTSADVATAIRVALAAETDAVLTGATYAADSETLTLTLSEGGPVTADLSGIATSGATLTGASFAADTGRLTLTLSAGEPVTADLSGLSTSSDVATAIRVALAAETDAVLTGASFAGDTGTLTLTLSDGGPVTADLSGIATSGATLTGASFAADTGTLTLTLSDGGPVTADLSGLSTSSDVATAISTALAAETDAVITGASFAGDTGTLTLTLSDGGPVTADLSGLSTSADVATAIRVALAAETDAVLTGVSFAGDTGTLTLTLSDGGPVTADLSGLSTSSDVATAIRVALAAETDAVITDASFTADSETLTLTLSDGGPVTADLSGLSTSAEVATAISTALAAETDAVITGASFAADTGTLTLTLSDGGPVTADLSGLSTSAEVATAISTALAAETDAVLTGASFAADSETLTLTLSDGGPLTSDLSDLTTDTELTTAITTAVDAATGTPALVGTTSRSGYQCQVFKPSDLVFPADGWVVMVLTAHSSEWTTLITQVAIPTSTLHDLPVKVSDTATTATINTFGANANSRAFNLHLNNNVYIGLTTTNRLVYRFPRNAFPCVIDVYTGPAVTAETVNSVSSATFSQATKTLTLTMSDGATITTVLDGVTTPSELTAAISTALAAETDAVLTGASFAADTGTLTLTLSDGGPVTADLSGLSTSSDVATAIRVALAAETDAVITGASFAATPER